MKLTLQVIILSVAATLLQVSCVDLKTIPTPEAIQQAYEFQLKRRDAEIRKLDEDKAKGTITQVEHANKLQTIKDDAYFDATESLWNNHQMNQVYRRSVGLPTPEQPSNMSSINF
jgi:hypothetical protein